MTPPSGPTFFLNPPFRSLPLADHTNYVPDVNFKKAKREKAHDKSDLFGDVV